MQTSLSKRAWGITNGAAAGALWGVVFLFPAVLHGFTALELSLGRFLAYGLISLCLMLPRLRATVRRLDRRDWITLVGLSLAGNLVYYVFVALAVQTAGGAATSLIVGLVPLVIAVVAVRDPASVPLRRLAPALFLSLVGVVLIAYQAQASATDSASWPTRVGGLLCAVGALLSWSGYSIGNSRALARRPDLTGHEWSLLTGIVTGLLALVLLPVAMATSTKSHQPGEWTAFWIMSAGVAVLASVMGNACWNRASRALPLSLSGQMIVFETLFALLYSFAWQQRWPTVVECLAMACLIAGVVLCARAHARYGAAESGLNGV